MFWSSFYLFQKLFLSFQFSFTSFNAQDIFQLDEKVTIAMETLIGKLGSIPTLVVLMFSMFMVGRGWYFGYLRTGFVVVTIF